MIASPFRRIAVIGAVAALSFALAAAIPTSFGPPWISIETPPNPFDATSRGAFLVVHTYHHGDIVASGVTGSAEGIVSGARRTIPLVFDTTTRRGTYALRKQWPNEGTWMLVINTGAAPRASRRWWTSRRRARWQACVSPRGGRMAGICRSR